MVTQSLTKSPYISATAKLHSVLAFESFEFPIRTDLVPAISNGNRTEWSPIRSVIIRVITKSTTAQRESDLFITSMITDRIGRHEVLLPINHKN